MNLFQNDLRIAENIRFLTSNFVFRVSNLAIIIIFSLLGLYAKIGGGRRGNFVSTLFADFFSQRFPLYGVFNSTSDILWCLAAGICWFTFTNLPSSQVRQSYKRFLLASAILLTAFLIDDLFRLTLILKVYLGIPKLFSYLMYGLSIVLYGYRYRKLLLSRPYSLLVMAIGLLVISGLVDIIGLPGKGTPALLEDGTKLLALIDICIFYWAECQQAFKQLLAATASGS